MFNIYLFTVIGLTGGLLGYLAGSVYTRWKTRKIHETLLDLIALHSSTTEKAAGAQRDRDIVETLTQLQLMGASVELDDEDEDPSIH